VPPTPAHNSFPTNVLSLLYPTSFPLLQPVLLLTTERPCSRLQNAYIWRLTLRRFPARLCDLTAAAHDVALVEQPVDLFQGEIGGLWIAEVLKYCVSSLSTQ
jgi:hypothetical protein